MGNSTIALIIVLCINAVLMLGQIAILEVNPDGVTFTHKNGTIYGEYLDDNYALNESKTLQGLPSGKTGVDPDTGNIFVDVFSSILDWLGSVTGLSYLWEIIGAPYHFLSSLGFPPAFTGIFGTMWYAYTFFVIIGWITGRGD